MIMALFMVKTRDHDTVSVIWDDLPKEFGRFGPSCFFCSDSLAFATEPVIASLANLLGNCERLGANVQQEFKVGFEVRVTLP